MSWATPLMKALQRVRTAHGQIAATVAVAIDVGHRMLAKFVGMSFAPFGRAEQPRFLAVPDAINNGALRLPSLFEQSRQGRALLPSERPCLRPDLPRR